VRDICIRSITCVNIRGRWPDAAQACAGRRHFVE
jgi:hypothetical protein